jgi:hypothetical protein
MRRLPTISRTPEGIDLSMPHPMQDGGGAPNCLAACGNDVVVEEPKGCLF